MNEFSGFKPRQDLAGFTAIPNEWFDVVLKSIDSLSELKVVQTVFRKTYGWVEGWDKENQTPIYKLEDSISYSQFEELTGMSRSSIAEGLKRAIAHGLIVRVSKGSYDDMSSSKYRIRLVGEPAQVIEESDEVVSAPKKVIEEEVKQTPAPAPKKKQTQYEKYKLKKPSDYNAVDMAYYFSDRYNAKLGIWYGTISQKDRSLLKQLIDGYKPEIVVKAIDWLMDNYQSVIGTGYPSVSVLYGFRTTVFPASQNVMQKTVTDVRQPHFTDEEVKGGGEVNTW